MPQQSTVAEMIYDAAISFEEKTLHQEEYAQNIANKTVKMIRISLIFLTVIAVFTALSIYYLSEDLQHTVTHMETMYKNFGTVTEEMSVMTSIVTAMEKNVSDVKTIAGSVSSMRQDVEGIDGDMASMDQQMGQLNKDISNMQYDMNTMNVMFDRVNHSMGRMRYDVREISRPMNIIPFP